MTYRDTRTYQPRPVPADRAYHVRLLMRFDAAQGPVDAVEQFIDSIVDCGLRGFMYRVTEVTTGESWLVQEGVVMTEEEAIAHAERLHQEDEGMP